MKFSPAVLAFLVGCPTAPVPLAPVPLPKQDAAKIEEWNGIVRGMRMDVVDGDGNVTQEKVAIHDVRVPTKPAVVALWATYCPPCLEEMPMLDELAREGHQVIGVSLDSDNLADVAKVLEEKSPHYPQAILQTWSMKRVGLSLEAGLPFTMILNRRGEVRYLFRGKTSKNELLSALGRL